MDRSNSISGDITSLSGISETNILNKKRDIFEHVHVFSEDYANRDIFDCVYVFSGDYANRRGD